MSDPELDLLRAEAVALVVRRKLGGDVDLGGVEADLAGGASLSEGLRRAKSREGRRSKWRVDERLDETAGGDGRVRVRTRPYRLGLWLALALLFGLLLLVIIRWWPRLAAE